MEGEETISSSIVGSRLGKAATAAAFVATEKPGAGRAGTPRDGPPVALTPRGGPGAGAERRTAEPNSFASRCKGRRPAEKSWAPPLRAWPGPGSSRPLEEGRGAALSHDGREPCATEAPPLPSRPERSRRSGDPHDPFGPGPHQPPAVLRGELHRDVPGEPVRAEPEEVGVEVIVERIEIAHLGDAGLVRPFAQRVCRPGALRIAVAGDVEPLHAGRELKNGEVMGREPGHGRYAGQGHAHGEHVLETLARHHETCGQPAEARAVSDLVPHGLARLRN